MEAVNGGHTSRVLWGAIAVAVLTAAALPAAGAADSGPKRPLRFEIKGVPFVKQRPDWCGPAALASVLQYHGEKLTQQQIAAEIYLPRRGTLNLDLLLFARRRGFVAAAPKGNPQLLKATLADGIPAICQVERRDLFGRRTHFVVVYGYDDTKRIYRLHQGTKGSVSVRQPAFEKAWKRGNHWMLTVRPKPKAPAHETP